MSVFEISYPSEEQLWADMMEDLRWEAEQEALITPEERARQERAEARLREEEAIGEMYASRYAFD